MRSHIVSPGGVALLLSLSAMSSEQNTIASFHSAKNISTMRNIASALDQRATLGVGHISYAQELPSSPSASIDEQRGTAQHQGTALVTVSKHR